MSGFTTVNTDYLTRSTLYSNQLKEILEDELMAQQYVSWITDQIPDGDTLNIPSIGQAEVADYVENTPVQYTRMDTGNFQFSINEYIHSGTYITAKQMQDSWLADTLKARFVPAQARAIAVHMESNILAAGPDGQTASDYNLINGARHRWVAPASANVITLDDFIFANHALDMANVPQRGRVAIVDPTVGVQLNKLAADQGFTYNPRWEGIVSTGMTSDMNFLVNIFGWDVYTSKHLKTGVETIGGVTAAAGVYNLFFSMDPSVSPIIGALRQPPKVDIEWNKDFQREEYVTTCRYDTALFRPENMVVVITDTDQVYA